RVEDQVVDWFTWKNSQFERLAAGEGGVHRSEVFPGLWLDAAAVLRGGSGQVLAVLQQGIATTGHSAFWAKAQKQVSRTFYVSTRHVCLKPILPLAWRRPGGCRHAAQASPRRVVHRHGSRRRLCLAAARSGQSTAVGEQG